MADYELAVSGLEELVSVFARLGRDVERELTPAMERAMQYLWGQLPSYPPTPQPGQAAQHWTDKQRRWFFWALKSGRIEVPYRRRQSAGLGGSLSTEVRAVSGEVIGLMGPSIDYAPYVVGLGTQAAIHQGRWWIIEEEVEKNLQGAVDILEAEVARLLATV